jgi:hypothetical protein
MMTPASTRQFRSIALPAEHGSWSFWLEPALLGLLVAPSPAGCWLALGSFCAFLVRQPFKIAWTDRQRGRHYGRTRLAERFAGFYVLLALLGFVIAVLVAGDVVILMPFALVSPLVLALLIYDMRHESRHWLPEVAAGVSMSSIAAGMALAGGWALAPALALSAIIIARALPTVFYVRARLRLEKELPTTTIAAIGLHGLAFFALALLAGVRLVPILSVVAGVILLLRAVYGLSRFRRPAPPKVIGIQEIVFGLITVTMAAAGFWWS